MILSHTQELNCWEIIGCKKTDECLAKKNPGEPCWEIAIKAHGYGSSFNICRDCLVFVIKQKPSVLSGEEITKIIATKTKQNISIPCPNIAQQQSRKVHCRTIRQECDIVASL
jgi:hypothetical protein